MTTNMRDTRKIVVTKSLRNLTASLTTLLWPLGMHILTLLLYYPMIQVLVLPLLLVVCLFINLFYSTQSARSFVVRGSQIGVFKTDAPNLKLVTSIKKVKDREGKFFSPNKVCLARLLSPDVLFKLLISLKLVLSEQDQSLLMLHPGQKNKLFKMDLNRSDVVEEWVHL